HPKMREEVLEVKGEFKAQAIGGDILVAIQAVPTLSAEKAAEMKNLGSNVAIDRPDSPPERDEPPPPPAPGRDRPTPAPTPEKAGGDEPSDEPL
ncbi:MAG: hypothetical protein ACYC8T_33050, partial [Myxococcaceae bacterium]